jgi:hypothetical protein
MNPVFIAVTRREYIRVGSAPASLLETVTSTNTEFMPHIPVSCPEQIMELAHAKFGEIQW